MDASALGVLVRARQLMKSCAGSMEVVSFSPVFLRLCVLTGLVSLTHSTDGREPELHPLTVQRLTVPDAPVVRGR